MENENKLLTAEGSPERLVSEFFDRTWKRIPAAVVEEIARRQCERRCRDARVAPPTEEQWMGCRSVWINAIRREHARGRGRYLANARASSAGANGPTSDAGAGSPKAEAGSRE